MKVVILCGGLGTRLREETEYLPKPMVAIGGRPILWHIMKTYAHFGHKEFILCLGYKGEVIKDYFRNFHWNTSDVTLTLGNTPKITYHTKHDEEDWKVTLLDTGQDTQTGGRLKRAIAFMKDPTFLLTYGDGLINSDINKSIEFHKKHKGTMTVTGVHPVGRFGEMSLDDRSISSFQEKPQKNTYISGGFFVVNRDIDKYLTGDACVLEKEPLAKLSQKRELKAFLHEGFWQCMDTFREQEILNKAWNSGNAPWKVW